MNLVRSSVCKYSQIPRLFSTMSTEVKHKIEERKFVMELDNGETAFVLYSPLGDGTVDLQRTLVPDSQRGKGLAKILAKAALDNFIASNTQMKISCWYLQKYVDENCGQHSHLFVQ